MCLVHTLTVSILKSKTHSLMIDTITPSNTNHLLTLHTCMILSSVKPRLVGPTKTLQIKEKFKKAK